MLLLLMSLVSNASADGSDSDDDDWPDSVDCEPDNPAVFPGAPELCNGIDDDCDADIDEECEGRVQDSGCGGVEDTGAALLLLPLFGMGLTRRRF